jgi:hypothetical protein
MICAVIAIGTHAQDFLVNDELPVPILKTFAQCIRSLHATRVFAHYMLLDMLDVCGLFVTVEQSVSLLQCS